MGIWYRICQMTGKIIIFLWLLKLGGAVPQKGAAVIISNHKSYIDPPLLGIYLNRRVWFLAKKQVLKWFFIGWLVKKSNWALSVSKNSMGSLREADEILKKGDAILLFPEGTRNKTGRLLKDFEKGFARLAIRNKAVVVPVAIIRRYKKLWWLPRGIKIIIAESISAENLNEQQLTQAAWQKIYSLLSQG